MHDEWMTIMLENLLKKEEYCSWQNRLIRANSALLNSLNEKQTELFLEYLSAESFLQILELEEAYRLGSLSER